MKDGRYFIVTRKKIELCVINQSAETMKRGEKDIAKLLEQKKLESAALKIVNSELGANGESNEWKGTAEVLVAPWLA